MWDNCHLVLSLIIIIHVMIANLTHAALVCSVSWAGLVQPETLLKVRGFPSPYPKNHTWQPWGLHGYSNQIWAAQIILLGQGIWGWNRACITEVILNPEPDPLPPTKKYFPCLSSSLCPFLYFVLLCLGQPKLTISGYGASSTTPAHVHALADLLPSSYKHALWHGHDIWDLTQGTCANLERGGLYSNSGN